MSGAAFGEAACLGAAFLWAFSVGLFRDPIRRHGAPAVNLVKCAIATALLGATIAIAGSASSIVAAGPRSLTLVVVSAWIGLTLGDTALFGAVARIGPSKALLLQTLAPVFTAVLAWVWPGEVPSRFQAWGSVLVLAGVGLVVARPEPADGATGAAGTGGFALGVLSAWGQGTGIVLAKAGMESMPVLPAAFVRMAAGTAGLVVLAAATGRLSRVASAARGGDRGRIAGASVLGAYVAMMLMMAGVATAHASVAAVLLSTTPVFGLGVDFVMLGRRPTVRGVVGTIVAVAGVFVLSRG